MLLSNMLRSLALFSLASLVRQGSASPKPLLSTSTRNSSAADPYLAPYSRPNGTLVPNEYVVMLHENHTLALHYDHVGQNLSEVADMFYPIHLINAYRARLDNDTVHNLVRSDPGVRLVQHDVYFYQNISYTPSREIEPRSTLNMLKRYTIYLVPRAGYWFQMMTSNQKLRTPVRNGGRYESLLRAGSGVHLYIMDTGIRLTHKVFQGRAVNFHDWTHSPYTDSTMDDKDGHGTHVAGLAGGRDIGVAMDATIVNVKIWEDGMGSMAGFSQAVNDITAEHVAYAKTNDPSWRGSVINISIGSTPPEFMAYQMALARANSEGVVIACSAGNSNENVHNAPCIYSLPKYGRSVVCVGAVDSSYKRWRWSNWGPPVQLAAPGVDITSASNKGDNKEQTMTGTSMASPLVAGVLATYVSWERIIDNPGLAFIRLKANWLDGAISYGAGTTALVQTGIHNGVHSPYIGAPMEPV